MAMTIIQLERYMISEIENLHIKIDSAVDRLMTQFKEMRDYMELRFDRIEARLDTHEVRLGQLEKNTQ